MLDFTIDNLILDAAPLLSTAASLSASSLRGMAKTFFTTPDVLAEIRDKTSRELSSVIFQSLSLDSNDANAKGLQVKEPPQDAIAKVMAFARLTGDIAVLSQADIRVLALTYAFEKEKNGTRRLREVPGRPSLEELEREAGKKERLARATQIKATEDIQDDVERLDMNDTAYEAGPHASTSSNGDAFQYIGEDVTTHSYDAKIGQDFDEQDEVPQEDSPSNLEAVNVISEDVKEEQTEDPRLADSDADSDSGEWITPSNVTLHKSRDIGLFPALPTNINDALANTPTGKNTKKKTILRVACLTGDFAMQNVALQMGLNVFGVGGKKVKEVRTWVLRCHACYKICKDPTRKFCPKCGNPSLLRTSISYVEPTPDNPQGYILHLKPNFQYRLRGTQYSLPPPKPGSSNRLKNSGSSDLVMREDQKEWTRGLKSAEILKSKQERAAAKAMKEGRGNAVFGGLSFDDPDWMPGMMSEKGRSGGQPGVRVGKDGLPIIGYGRRNPNEVRRGGKR